MEARRGAQRQVERRLRSAKNGSLLLPIARAATSGEGRKGLTEMGKRTT